MWTEGSNRSRLWCCSSLIKSNTQRISSCCEETTNVRRLTKSMDSTKSAKGDTALSFGSNFLWFFHSCLWLLWFLIRFFACMEDSLLSFRRSSSFRKFKDCKRFLIVVLFVICFGQTRVRQFRPGIEMTEGFLLSSERFLWRSFLRKTIWIWFAELIK